MKSQHPTSKFLKLIFGIGLLFSTPTFASHLIGGGITYEHLTGCNYRIQYTLYRDCAGIPAPTNPVINIVSVSCGISTSLSLTPLVGTGQEVYFYCPSYASTCSGGSMIGIQKWEYEGMVCLSQCNDWRISYSDCCRNPVVTTLANPGGQGIYIEARLNNSITNNSSPIFSNDVKAFACIGNDFIFNNGMIDPDGDSLVYTLIPARSAVNSNLVYNPGYSAFQPLSSIPPASFNSQTGDFFVHPTQTEVGIVVFQIQDYRNGVLMGSVMREIILYTYNCSGSANQPPSLSGINGTQQDTFYIYPGMLGCFNIFSNDPDTGDTLTMIWNNTIPSAYFSSSGGLHPTGTFCWNTTLSDLRPQPYEFIIHAYDQNCPLTNDTLRRFYVYVTLDTSLTNQSISIPAISGRVYYDSNSDGIQNNGEGGMSGIRLNILPDSTSVFTNSSGQYYFLSQVTGSHLISPVIPSGGFITSDSLSYTVADDTVSQSGFDFGINGTGNSNLEVYLGGWSRCSGLSHLYLNYSNNGYFPVDGRIIFVYDTTATFITSGPPPDLINSDTLYFNFTNLQPFSNHYISITLSYSLPAHTPVHYYYAAQYDSLGTYYTADETEVTDSVNCSIDPNAKQVHPAGILSPHLTLYTEELVYDIHFQNTGNDTAYHVRVMDRIDPVLDLNTFELIGSSHEMNTTIYPGRMVEFNFTNILLPDSGTDWLGSNGFVMYKIKAASGITLPALAENYANIYFDMNSPVQTNTVFNTLVMQLPLGIPHVNYNSEQPILFPNPLRDRAELLLGKAFSKTESVLRVFNTYGQEVFTQPIFSNKVILNLENLIPEIYFYEVKNKNGGRATGKFIVE